MSTEKKKEQQLLEELSAQPAARSSYSTAGLSSRREVENALAKAEYSPSQSVTDAAADLKNWQQNRKEIAELREKILRAGNMNRSELNSQIRRSKKRRK